MKTPRLITISEFVRMMGRNARSWYYDHRNEPGFPQPVGKPPMLVLSECEAFIQRQIDERDRRKGRPLKEPPHGAPVG